MTRSITSVPSRRTLLRGLARTGLGLGAARVSAAAGAKKRKKGKQARRNGFGCVNVGDFCKNASQCCSGICAGQQCRAHDTGNCAAGSQLTVCGGTNVACTTSLGKAGRCATTTGKAGYCGAGGDCFACTTDAECQAAEDGAFGPRAACIRCAGHCLATGGTTCVGPDLIEVPL